MKCELDRIQEDFDFPRFLWPATQAILDIPVNLPTSTLRAESLRSS